MAQAVPAKEANPIARYAQHTGKHTVSQALRGINTTVVRPRRAVNYYWDGSTSSWKQYVNSLQEYTYDSGARVTQELYKDSATAVNSSRYLYTYDARGEETSYTSQSWDNNAWRNESRYLSTYDARGNQTESLSQRWNGSTWTTDYGSKSAYTYNTAGVLTEEIRQELENGVYVNNSRQIYTVTNGQWSSLVSQEWDNGAWVTEDRILDIVWYDWAKLRPASFRTQEYDGNAFVDKDRYTITYAANGGSVEINQRYINSAWVNYRRYTNLQDANGNELGYTEDTWVNNAWRLEYGQKNILIYNSSNAVLRKVEQQFDEDIRQYVNSYRSNYSNFQTITLAAARNAALEARATLYPNPAADLVTLVVADVPGTEAATGEVRNALGQLVQQFTARPQAGQLSTQLDLSNLKSGVYTVRLQTSAGSLVKRVVRN
ncbi:T9SS type A sorting domain-containing protein [Hymenobacter elongatus]|uniref:T9SS type A sorting domain-containing protein n=1 Tax=Hymenobacter elongatus TaxID=877208 RepID=UPI0014368F74|nr:T9SS type A sorting domain-containing protein [Hymenobacter elongatus]